MDRQDFVAGPIRPVRSCGEREPLLRTCLFVHRHVIQANLSYMSPLREAVAEQVHLVAMRLDEFRMRADGGAHISGTGDEIPGI